MDCTVESSLCNSVKGYPTYVCTGVFERQVDEERRGGEEELVVAAEVESCCLCDYTPSLIDSSTFHMYARHVLALVCCRIRYFTEGTEHMYANGRTLADFVDYIDQAATGVVSLPHLDPRAV